MEPLFKDEKYYEGISKGIKRIQRAMEGEYENDIKKEREEFMFFVYLCIGIGICGIIAAFVFLIGSILGGTYGAVYWYILAGHDFSSAVIAFFVVGVITFFVGLILRAGVTGEFDSSGGSGGGGDGLFSSGGGSLGGGGASGSW